MQEGKAYALRMDLRSVSGQGLTAGKQYGIVITKDAMEKQILDLRVDSNGEIPIGQKIQFRIPGGELWRQSKCAVRVVEVEGRQMSREWASFEFLIMNYKNYSKNSFKMMSGDRNVGIINMAINISSLQFQNNKERSDTKPTKKVSIKKEPLKIEPPAPLIQLLIPPPQIQAQSLESLQNIQPSINIKAPIQEIKLVCPSEAPKEPKSMFSAFDNSGIVIQTRKDVEAEGERERRRRSDRKTLSSMGELFEKKLTIQPDSSLKLPVNDNMIKSCRLSPSRLQKDSRYCKEIQQNLDNLSALDQESNLLSTSRSPLKEQADFNIFDTLHRMKDKFEKIHEHEGFLNEEPALDELPEVEEETEEKDKLLISENKQGELKLCKSERYPQNELGRSTIINLEVHSAVSQLGDSDQNYPSQCHITKTVDLRCSPTIHTLRITPTLNLLVPPTISTPHSSTMEIPHNKRYKLAKFSAVTPFEHEPEDIEVEVQQKPIGAMTQSLLNFQIEEESLKRVSYIKLNKISHLSRAADISKRRNNFLIKANEELKVCQRLAEQKLQISKKIISEKEDILLHEFESLRQHMRVISNNLSLKNEESLKREQKVKSLQALVEQYARDINALKEDLKIKNANIKDLKCLLALKEDAESKVAGRREGEELMISKNFREAMEELLAGKGRAEKDDAGKKGMGVLGEFFQSDQRDNSSKTFLQQRRVRKFSSIDNTVNINQEDNADKSADQSNRTFRKFSHSKTASFQMPDQFQTKQGSKAQNNVDLVFQKLTGLFAGDSSGRVLKNL